MVLPHSGLSVGSSRKQDAPFIGLFALLDGIHSILIEYCQAALVPTSTSIPAHKNTVAQYSLPAEIVKDPLSLSTAPGELEDIWVSILSMARVTR